MAYRIFQRIATNIQLRNKRLQCETYVKQMLPIALHTACNNYSEVACIVIV